MNDRIRSPYSHAPHIRLRPVLPQLSMNLHLRSKFAFSAYPPMVAVSAGNVNLFSQPSPARNFQMHLDRKPSAGTIMKIQQGKSKRAGWTASPAAHWQARCSQARERRGRDRRASRAGAGLSDGQRSLIRQHLKHFPQPRKYSKSPSRCDTTAWGLFHLETAASLNT